MISRSLLMQKLKRELSPQLFNVLPESFFEEIIHDEALRRFSSWYWMICDIRITSDCAIPYKDYTGRIFNYSTYRIPKQFSAPGIDSSEAFEWIDIEDYQIGGNDTSDVLTGGNFLLNNMFLSARASMPHVRSYFLITFREPDLLIINPPMNVHRDFNVQMKAYRRLQDVPKNMEHLFMRYVVALVKYYAYNRLKYETGSQIFGGIEIDTKIDDLKDAEGEIKEIEDIFDKDYYKSPEIFSTICLYQKKSS